MSKSAINQAKHILAMGNPLHATAIGALIDGIAAANSLDEATAAVEILFRPYIQAGIDLAHAVVKQQEEGGQAGTHAYDMLASYAAVDAATTHALVGLITATVLRLGFEKRIDFDEYDCSVRFTPKDVDATFQNYVVDHTNLGLETHVHIRRRQNIDDFEVGLMVQDEDTTGARDQVQPMDERPVWVVRYMKNDGLHFHQMKDREDAERQLPSYQPVPGFVPPTIENRCCLHLECPATRCNEVTSGQNDDTSGVDNTD